VNICSKKWRVNLIFVKVCLILSSEGKDETKTQQRMDKGTAGGIRIPALGGQGGKGGGAAACAFGVQLRRRHRRTHGQDHRLQQTHRELHQRSRLGRREFEAYRRGQG